jgi:hypothetical protein
MFPGEKNRNGGALMKKSLFVSILVILIGGFFALAAVADDNHHGKHDNTLVRFKGGIGVIPISNVVVDATTGAITVNRNTVRGVNSPGQIWRIKHFEAKIKDNGDIKVEGKGLVLAGGNGIGRPPAGTSVFATLICEAAAPFIEHSTPLTGVLLAPNGDFKIDDVLVPIPPSDCASPVLLIRSANGGNWFAVGIPDLDDHDRH